MKKGNEPIMKNIFFALSLCLLILSSCGHNESYENDYETYLPGLSNYIRDILSIRNSDGDIIYYGMSRTDVERILGQGMPGFGNIYSYEISRIADISILYRDDIAVLIMLTGRSNWELSNGTYVGMQVYGQQVFYGMTIEENRQFLRDMAGLQEHEHEPLTLGPNFRFILLDNDELILMTNYEEYRWWTSRMRMSRADALRNFFMVDLRLKDDAVDIITIGDHQALIQFR